MKTGLIENCERLFEFRTGFARASVSFRTSGMHEMGLAKKPWI